jgi:hypothetical protein
MKRAQALQVSANAINASAPMGLGFLHFEPKEYTAEEVESQFPHYDYFEGRMVKLSFIEKDGEFLLPDGNVDIEYQSWAGKYPTYHDLAQSA